VALGGEDDGVPLAAGQCLAGDDLALTGGVDVGGVDEVDAGVEGTMDDADGVVVIGVAPRAEHHVAEAEGADGHAGLAKGAVAHGSDRTVPP
jgi:hypothetical protein